MATASSFLRQDIRKTRHILRWENTDITGVLRRNRIPISAHIIFIWARAANFLTTMQEWQVKVWEPYQNDTGDNGRCNLNRRFKMELWNIHIGIENWKWKIESWFECQQTTVNGQQFFRIWKPEKISVHQRILWERKRNRIFRRLHGYYMRKAVSCK